MSCLVNHFQLHLPICLPRQLDGELTWAQGVMEPPILSAQILPSNTSNYCCWKKVFSSGFFSSSWIPSEPGKINEVSENSDIHHLNWCSFFLSWNKWKIMTRVLGLAYPHLPTEASTFILTGKTQEKNKKTYVDGRYSGEPVEVGSWNPIIYKLLCTSRVVGLGISEPSTGMVGISHLFTALH